MSTSRALLIAAGATVALAGACCLLVTVVWVVAARTP